LVRQFRSDDPPDMSAQELERELIPRYWIAPPASLPRTAGMHRWVWDLRYPAPTSTTRGFPISAVPHATPREPQGPTAVPGDYRIRLTVDGHRLEQPLALLPDPRVKVATADLQKQFELTTAVAALLTRSSQAQLEAQSQQSQLHALESPAAGGAAQAIKDFNTKISALPLAELQTQLNGLYAQVGNGAAAPTAAEVAAAHGAGERLEKALEQWQELQSGLPALNKTLKKAGLATIRTGMAPPRDLNAADED
jgi:hypothetical protein